ncbi:MAG TPA: sugar ABC transporter permease, partial [Candidatus Blautia pullicola]|nr:sugar ABC transporter permease [Candidatus Blautia pullicola]
ITKKAKLTILLFVLPALIVYLIWVIYPIISAIWMSMLKSDTLHSSHFAGLENYISVFESTLFWKSMKISIIFIIVTTIFQVILGFFYGYLVYLQPKGYRIYKILLFIPNVLPSVASGFIWSYIYSPSMGVLKPLMEGMGLGEYYISPIADPKMALYAVIFAQIWCGLGVQVILFNSGFMNIPSEVIESARLDGATGWKMIKTMVIPMSWDITKMVIILQTIGALRSFDLIYVMTSGGPNHSTEVLPMHLFVNAFQNFNLGYGNVVAVVLFVLAMIITAVMRKVMERDSLY